MDSTRYQKLLPSTDTSTPRQASTFWILVVAVLMLASIAVLIVVPPMALSRDHGAAQLLAKPPHPQPQEHTMVRVKDGFLRGAYKDGVRVFHGVPFAEPPVGELRWRPPRPKNPWHPAVREATSKQAACLQNPSEAFPEAQISEDCLYLEIFAPHKPIHRGSHPFPVLVYLHGGAYKYYSATDKLFDATQLVRRADIVVVLVEYRLGAMGFLVSGDEQDVQGNYGLLDQRMALRWVHYNIHAFGGDAKRVTLAGQSAGAQSAIVHLMSKTSSKFFRSIILESPPVPLPVKTFAQGAAQTKLVSDEAKCPATDEGGADMACLRRASAYTILRAQKKSKSFSHSYIDRVEPWGPVIDRKLVQGPLMNGFKQGRDVPKMPILWGVTSEEAILFIRFLHPKPASLFLYMFAKKIFGDMGVDTRKLAHLYPYVSKDSRKDIAHMLTDFVFRCPMKWSAHQVSSMEKTSQPPMWTYVFERSMGIPRNSSLGMCSHHACHGTEIPYVFNTFRSFNISVTSVDQEISESIIQYYDNFVRYGDPNGRLDDKARNNVVLPHWPETFEDKGDNKYQTLVFGRDGVISSGPGVEARKCDLWSRLYL